MIDADREWETWRTWLGGEPKGPTIYAEVVEMLAFRKIWEGFALIYDAAPEQARKDSTFLWWVRWNYGRSAGSAIRRQTEVRNDVISLARLIDRIWRYPTVLTVERFDEARGYDDSMAANEWMELTGFSGEVIYDDDFINPEVPAQDLEDLRAKTAKVCGWVNKAVAHKDAKGREAPPLSEVHACIDAIFEVFNKYMALIRGVRVTNEVVMPIWPTIFRTQWIPDDQWEVIESAVGHIDLQNI
jgi:hypothetical protein